MNNIRLIIIIYFSFPLKGHPPKTNNGNGSSGGIIENPVELRYDLLKILIIYFIYLIGIYIN